jgi:hypothetical protein
MCDNRRGMDWILYLLITCIHHSELHQITDKPRLVSSVCYSLHWPFPGKDFYQGRFFSFPRSGLLVTAARAELLPTDNSTNCVPEWRPYHTKVLDFSSLADFQLATGNFSSLAHQPATSRHFNQLNC